MPQPKSLPRATRGRWHAQRDGRGATGYCASLSIDNLYRSRCPFHRSRGPPPPLRMGEAWGNGILASPVRHGGGGTHSVTVGALQESVFLPPQTRPVRRNNVPIPRERFLAVSRERPRPVVVAVHIDKAVTLRHLRRGRAHEVDAAPRRIAHDGHAVRNRLLHLHEMVAVSSGAGVSGYVGIARIMQPI